MADSGVNLSTFATPENYVMQHILLIDNFDSFTFNLVQLLRESGVTHQLSIVKNDADIGLLPAKVDKVIISPGPGLPHESGKLMPMLNLFAGRCPVLGICLGHQAIALHYGGKLIQLPHSAHGQVSKAKITEPRDVIFREISTDFLCGRYHSWVVDPETLPDALRITALDGQGNIMALKHRELNITGLQFHPESYMTPEGGKMINTWLRL